MKIKSENDWFEIITGVKKMKIPDQSDFRWQMHCTACGEVMIRGKCINNNCKYFNK